ncbi:MFS transporter [Alkalihalobacillus sp. 1P02AB]|uniref:MFS transporter n=1 Tax=Alkalihalobacillus sp. 1P02AB TaxID=3132260 RepID=UPI0039A65DC2
MSRKGEGSHLAVVGAVLIGFLPFIMVLGNSLFIPLMPTIQMDLHLTSADAGLFLSVFSLPAALIIPLSGVFTNRFGYKKVILSALMILIVGSLLAMIAVFYPGSQLFSLLLAGRLLQGIGAGLVTPLAFIIATDWFSGRERNQALGMIEAFNGLAKVLSPIIGAAIILISTWSFSLVFYFVCILLTWIGMSILFAYKADGGRKQKPATLSLFLEELRRSWALILAVFAVGFGGMFVLFGYLVYLSYEFEGSYLVEDLQKGILLSIPLACLTISSYLSGKMRFPTIYSSTKMIVVGMFMMFLGILLPILYFELISLVVGSSMFSFGFGIFLSIASQVLAVLISGQIKSITFSLYSMVRFLGVALGPIFYSYWIDDAEQIMFTSLSLIGILLIIWIVIHQSGNIYRLDEGPVN